MLKMSKEVSVHVVYGYETGIFTCKRPEFVSKVAQRFNIKENEIEIYDWTTSKRINVDNFSPVMKVEVKRKNAGTSYNGASTSKGEPNPYANTIQKLRDNTSLTGLERSFLVDLLSGNGSLNLHGNNDNIKLTRNVKIQVNSKNLIPERSTECQTDKTINETPAKRNLETNDVMYQSKRLASSEKVDPAKAKQLMDKLYDERRSFILVQLPLASFVKEKYPLLFSLAEVRNEIDRILHHGKCEQFLKNIDKYSKHVLSLVREDDPLLLTIKRKIASFTTKIQKKYALQVGSLLMISSLMHEERGYLKLIDQPLETSNFPYIEAQAKLSEIYFDQHLFKVYVEGHLLCEASDFKEAILCLVGSYYIFNIRYPDINWNTFAIFEQIYLDRNDTDDLDDDVLQIIRGIHLKAQASDAGPSKS